MSDLDDMWYVEDKESNIQVFEDEDLFDKEDFKEEMNAYIVEGRRPRRVGGVAAAAGTLPAGVRGYPGTARHRPLGGALR
jgi:hypothetical protein